MSRPIDHDHEFRGIHQAIKIFRQNDRSASGMVFTDNWYDSHPRLLIFDPVLNPYDKLVWMSIRSYCSPDMSMVTFPSYDQIQSSLHISRGTVASSITKLRATRWLTLICREKVRNEVGQISKDGNIYLIHGEPLGFSDTFKLDSNYMQFLQDSRNHRNSDVRKISELIINSIRCSMEHSDKLFADSHPFDRRSDAWAHFGGENNSTSQGRPNMFTHPRFEQESTSGDAGGKVHTTAVHPIDHGVCEPAVHSIDYSSREPVVHAVNHGKQKVCNSSSGIKSNRYNYHYDHQEMIKEDLSSSQDENSGSCELIYPSSLSNNQKHLIELHLQRLPDSLPVPPKPWNDWRQLLLDELAGRIEMGINSKCDSVWNPVSLMSTYCQKLLTKGMGLKSDGHFQVEHAEAVIEKRRGQKEKQRAVADARERYRRRIDHHIRDSRETTK
ncbi:MAG: STY4528 family pathogenicity island replication protein [Acidiferrobacterales bacterium]|nr:STY4528 family pathogenicity island replication protein [Acidiferrobacterales bacterium]